MTSHDVRVVFSTATPDEAPALVRTLVEERLVACGNIVPGVRSIYRWQGEVCDEVEVALFLETTLDRLDAALARLAVLHSYDCPKLVVLTPTDVDATWAEWVAHSTRPPT
jgi:periplasmic divalent cation tolerance protein